ncbi:ATP-binding response regulator [Pseudomonas sp. HK3]
MDKLSMIKSTIAKGFPWLIFPPALEHEFRGFIRQRILNRVLPIGISAAIFIIVFTILDWFTLSPDVALHTSIIRLFIVLPIIITTTLWLYFKPPKYYLWVYCTTLIISSLSVIYIIWLSHTQGINLPYEGLMIIMMYAFFIMAMPFYVAFSINIFMVFMYAITEPFLYLNFNEYINNVLFLSIVFISAAIGAYVTEHNQRANFLRKRILDIHHNDTLKSIKQRNKYLASASHDIRQPLQGLTLIAQNLQQQKPNDIYIKNLNHSADILNAMFTQMMDISKINLNLIQPKISVSSLVNLLTQNTQAFIPRLKQHNINLNLDIHACHIKSDITLLSRIIHNLIENIIQHSDASNIDIKSNLEDNCVTLSITDNGKGIPETTQKNMYREFIKGEESKNGLGLGLAIVYQFCQKLGLSLQFNSHLNHTEFTMTIPLSDVISKNNIEHENPLSNAILLVDDNPDVLEDIKKSLINWGHNVICANGLQHAMSIIEKQQWHCVITDWDLSDGCGETIIGHTHQHNINSILISSRSNEDLIRFCQNNKSHYLPKPVSLSRLRSILLKFK